MKRTGLLVLALILAAAPSAAQTRRALTAPEFLTLDRPGEPAQVHRSRERGVHVAGSWRTGRRVARKYPTLRHTVAPTRQRVACG